MKLTKRRLKSKSIKEEEELFKLWANEVKSRDGWACVVCGSKEKPNAHHLIPREVKEYRFSIDNGITLCIKHHKFSRKLSAHNNAAVFLFWLRIHFPLIFAKLQERSERMIYEETIKNDSSR